MRKRLILTCLVLFIGCSRDNESLPLLEQTAQASSFLIKGINIFNGRDPDLIMESDVLVEGGIIKEIGRNLERKSGVELLRGNGKFLMPGLIDAHVHLSGSGAVPWENARADISFNLQAYLFAGITTVYDLGGLAGDISDIGERIEKKELIGPSVYNTHIPITVKNSHPIPLTEIMLPWPLSGMVNMISPTIDKPSDAEKLVKKYCKNDIDFVKVIIDQIPPGSPQMNLEQLKALVEESHKQGMKVIAHIGSPQNAIDAIDAGVDVLAHGVWRGKLTQAQAKKIADSQVPIIYTISGFRNVAQIHHGHYSPSEMDRKLVVPEILDPVTMERGKDVHEQKVMNRFFKEVADQSPHWQHNFRLLNESGAPILVGTDSNLPGTYAGSTYYQELDELKAFGMSNFEILKAATFLNARLFLKEPDFGSIERGKRADLLIVDQNPLEELNTLKDPALIIKGGIQFKRAL